METLNVANLTHFANVRLEQSRYWCEQLLTALIELEMHATKGNHVDGFQRQWNAKMRAAVLKKAREDLKCLKQVFKDACEAIAQADTPDA